MASNSPDLFSGQDATPRRQKSQLLLTMIYNKVALLHLLPGPHSTTVTIYEVDPNFTYKN